MRSIFTLAPALFLAACAVTPPSSDDYPEEKVNLTGSHIPVKDKETGKAVSTGDADAMIKSQKVLGAPAGVSPAAARSN
jgi:hypothetical protein